MPFKEANEIIIGDTMLLDFGKHLVKSGFDVKSYWPEFGLFITAYIPTSKMNFAYRFHCVRSDTAISCCIFLKRNSSQVSVINETGDISWEYRESSSNVNKIVYDDLILILL